MNIKYLLTIHIDKKVWVYIALLVSYFVFVFFLSKLANSVLFYVLFLSLYIVLVAMFWNDLNVNRRVGYQFLVIFPVLSAIQYIGLSTSVQFLSRDQVNLVLSLGFILSFTYIIILSVFLRKSQKILILRIILGILFFFLLLTIVFDDIPLTAVASSLRNLVSPITFFFLAVFGISNSNKKISEFLIWLGWGIVIFGIVEKFIFTNLWVKDLNYLEIWYKRGLTFFPEQYPTSFYSSEHFNGVPIRRMLSVYADPVNFGTVLFLVFNLAWYAKRYLLLIASAFCMLFAVSKGALLGVIIFFIVFSYFQFKRLRISFLGLVFGLVLGGVIGYLFLDYASENSTGSVFAHISGLMSGFQNLAQYPFGHGIGASGTLSSVLRGEIIENGIQESGFGMIMGQMGIVGFIFYMGIFSYIFLLLGEIKDMRQALIGYSLFFGIFANILFNEVALSPNSCAGYFIVLGSMINDAKRG